MTRLDFAASSSVKVLVHGESNYLNEFKNNNDASSLNCGFKAEQ